MEELEVESDVSGDAEPKPASSSPTEDVVEFSRSEGDVVVFTDWAIRCLMIDGDGVLKSGGGGGGGGKESSEPSPRGEMDDTTPLMPPTCSALESEPVEDCEAEESTNEAELTRSRFRPLSLLPPSE